LSGSLTESQGEKLLTAQYTYRDNAGVQRVNQERVNYWLGQAKNNGAEAYRMFLWDYTNTHIQPSRFR